MHCSTQWLCDYLNYCHEKGRAHKDFDHPWTLEETEKFLSETAEWHVFDEETGAGMWYLEEKK